MIKFWSIEHKILDLLDLINLLNLLNLLDLLETNDDLQFKELINFMIFIDHARVSGDDKFTDLKDAEMNKSVLGYRVFGF
jgi:hypothetical protein